MFLTKNVQCLFKKAALKLETNDEGRECRMCEATLVIGMLSIQLARELGDEIAGHLFDENGGMRHEVDNIMLHVDVGLQRVTFRSHWELEPVAILEPVSIKSLRATREEDLKKGTTWFELAVVVAFELTDKAARSLTIDHFGNPVFLTYESMQHALPLADRIADAITDPNNPAVQDFARKVAGSDGGSVSIEAGGRKISITSEKTTKETKH